MPEVGDETVKRARVAWKRKVVDARVVGEAEVEAWHRLPREHSIVGDVFLVHISVAREEAYMDKEKQQAKGVGDKTA